MSNRAILIAALLIALAGLWACWCDVALLWDGAYQFCASINAGHAFAYLSRFHSWVVWQPFIWLSHVTQNVRLLKMAYGAPYCFAPLVSVVLSWWIVRRPAPHLMVWAIFGAAGAALPGQIFMINDSIFQMHLFWPVFLAIFLPLSRTQTVAMLLLSLFQLSHPIGVGLCLLCSVSALAFARWGTPERRSALLHWAAWFAILCLGGIAKLILWPDAYAAREASAQQVWMTFRWGVLWWPLFGLIALWLAASVLVWARSRPESRIAGRAPLIVLGLILFAGGCWIYWATDVVLWQTALNYRRWLVPMSMPLLLAAGWELWRLEHEQPQPLPLRIGRDRAGMAIAAIFLVVLGIQSQTWSQLYHRLGRQVASTPGLWLQQSDLTWIKETPMDHWGLCSQVILSQGQRPRVLLLEPGDDRLARENPPQLALSSFTYFTPSDFPRSWFDWSAIVRATHASASR